MVKHLATVELAKLLTVLAHPHRIRIIEELRSRELDVNSIQQILEVSHSRASQQLSVLRARRIVAERREGRHVFYSLQQPELAEWLVEGLRFIEQGLASSAEMRESIKEARRQWSEAEKMAKGQGSQ